MEEEEQEEEERDDDDEEEELWAEVDADGIEKMEQMLSYNDKRDRKSFIEM